MEKKPWYEYKTLVRLLLVFCYPVGLYAFGRCSNKPKVTMGIMSTLVGGFVILIAVALVQTIKNPKPLTQVVESVEDSFSDNSITNTDTSTDVLHNNDPTDKELIKSTNPLLYTTLFRKAIINSVGNNIGIRAYVEIDQSVFNELSFEEITEFWQSVQDKNFNWLTIFIGPSNKRGLFFGGAGTIGECGPVDELGRISGTVDWRIIYDENTKLFKELKM